MTAVADLGVASRMLRDALKDKSYRSTPLGLEVARYVRWKRNEWGATTETIRDYESILARLALFFADLEMKDFETPVGAERLRECWDYYWGEAAGRTRSKVLSVWRDFFDWAVREQRGLHGNPARMLSSPKRRGVKREPFGKSFVELVISRQAYVGDKLGVILVLGYGLRRAELAAVRFRDFDFEWRTLTITGKGGKVRVIPIVANNIHGRDDHPTLIAETRRLIKATGLPYVIENVEGARAFMCDPHTICGLSLGLGVKRHRLFETSFDLMVPPCHSMHAGDWVSVFGQTVLERGHVVGKAKGGGNTIKRRHLGTDRGRDAMGISWMNRDELSEAVPPLYTELVGAQLLAHIRAAAPDATHPRIGSVT